MTRAKVKRHVRVFDVRHTFATRAVASGVDLPTRRALLRQTSIQMTMRHIHPTAAQKEVAIQDFDKFSTSAIIAAAAAEKNQRVPTKVTAIDPMETIRKVLKRLARPARFERATLCLEGRCSIQLSYGRAAITVSVYGSCLNCRNRQLSYVFLSVPNFMSTRP
jgi:hypothetical protein